MIYFVKCGDNVKIGYTQSLMKRISGLQTSSAEPLELLGVMHGERAKEIELHKMFECLHIRGEWFKLTNELVKFINENVLPEQERADAEGWHLPSLGRVLEQLGNNIRQARLRRDISSELLAERAGISRPTLRAIESGKPTISMGSYASVLFSLGLYDDLAQVGKADPKGRVVMDAKTGRAQRASRRRTG